MSANTQQLSDQEKANKWWGDMHSVERTYFENKHFPDHDPEKDSPFLSNAQILYIWRKETQPESEKDKSDREIIEHVFPTTNTEESSTGHEATSGELQCTPGEWAITGGPTTGITNYRCNIDAVSISHKNVARSFGDNREEAEANAHLIAASKLMYSSLKKYHESLLEYYKIFSEQKSPEDHLQNIRSEMVEVLSILKKANPKLT